MVLKDLEKYKLKLKEIIERNDIKAGRIFDYFIQSLILISLICFSIETLPDLNQKVIKVLNIIEIVTVIIFSIEYILRIISTEKKIKYIFSFYGIIDLIAILPFYFSRGVDLRSIRVFRLFRLTRTLKLVKYNKAIKKFHQAFILIKNELIIFLIATFFLLYTSSVGIYYFEHTAQPEQFGSVFHSLWWAVATLTTVGYGDVYPITVGGKIFTFVMLMIGLGIIAVPTGLIASALTKVIQKEGKEK
jgi:voltage-gated potassium channel